MDKKNILTEALKKLNIELTEESAEMFIKYYEMLIEKNKVMNLTAITDYDEAVIKHFADSLSLVKVIDPISCSRMLDIGTGAGFPGIPLKIAFPEINITLLDSLEKRISFLNEVIDKLQLNNSGHGHIEAVHSRAEDFIKNDGIREGFDLVVSRAVAALPVLSEYCLPYVKVGGSFIAYKSERADEETESAESALKILGGKIDKAESFILPDSNINRTLIVIKKTCPTPDKYPRKAGLPSKKPLS